jgi:hypothetical protein
MTYKHLLAPAAIAAIITTAAPAATPAAHYAISVRMQDGDRPATNPRLLVQADEPASFVIANDSYSLRMVATPDAEGHVTLASEVSSWTPHGLANDAQTIRLEAGGEARSLSFAHTDPTSGTVSRIRLDVSVRPVS